MSEPEFLRERKADERRVRIKKGSYGDIGLMAADRVNIKGTGADTLTDGPTKAKGDTSHTEK